MVHHLDQGEGVEQGDAMMPLWFSVEQNAALVEVQDQLRASERLFAFLMMFFWRRQTLTGFETIHALLHTELCRHSEIHVNRGKTQV